LAPDPTAEVVSPGDSATEVESKARGWLRARTRLVWVVYPESKTVAVYRPSEDPRVLTENETLDGHPIFEDFRVLVQDLFA